MFALGRVVGGSDWVLERWEFPPEAGAFYTTRTRATSAVGTPAPFSVLEGAIAGGAHVPPAERRAIPPRRSALCTTSKLRGVLDVAVDPEARFVLVLQAGPPAALVRVHAWDGAGAALVEPILDARDASELASVRSLRPACIAGKGRCYLLQSEPWAPHASVVVLEDADNDGVFERHVAMSYAGYERSEY